MALKRIIGHFLAGQQQRWIVCSDCFCIGKIWFAKEKGKKKTYGMQIETIFAPAKAWAEESHMIDKLQKSNRCLGWQKDDLFSEIYDFLQQFN